jgi:predicted ATPase/class 3 adenylate cyclase
MSRKGPVSAAARSNKREKDKKTSSPVEGGERKIITALCYDLVGSTQLFSAMDIEDYQDLIDAFQQGVREAIEARSGLIQTEAGDGGVALFPTDIGIKDAASLAIRAGLDVIEACKRLGSEAGRELKVRVGIATSFGLTHEPRQGGGPPERISGAALAMATRLEAIAIPDSVFVSDEIRNLAGRSHTFTFQGTQILKGFTEPEKVWRALGHRKGVDRFYAFGRISGPFVGRSTELETLSDIWRGVLSGHGEIVAIDGLPGIGKSRLLYEIRKLTRRERSRSFFLQCSPGGFRSTLHPLLRSFPARTSDKGAPLPLTVSSLASLFGQNGVHDSELIEVFAYLLGAQGRNELLSNIDPKVFQERARSAVDRAFEELSQNGPFILAVEDIHWIDPTSLDLLTEAARIVKQFPALIIVTSRPNASNWLDKVNPRRISLSPLDRDATRQIIESAWPEHRRDLLLELSDVTERISGGIPLFIEEICQWAAESASGTLTVPGSASISHASTFEGMLDTRLRNLGSSRDVARAGSVAGLRFTLPLLCALLPEFGKRSLATAVDKLCRAGILSRINGSKGAVYSFRHALIQETVYNALLKKQQRTLHRRLFDELNRDRQIAPWIDTGGLAEHAERAGLMEEAVERFISAGKESSGRSAMVEARQHLEHALELCEKISQTNSVEALQLSALTTLGPILIGMVGLSSPPARKLYEDGAAIARRQPTEDQPRWFPIYWGWWLTGSDFSVMHDRALQVQEMLSDVEDPEIRLQVNHCIWAIAFNRGHHRETQDAIAAGLALYDPERAMSSRTLYGGHDAKVCGLGQLSLSLWLTGEWDRSDKVLSKMIKFVDQISHVSSRAHSLDTEAVSAFYRDDYDRLADVSRRMSEFAATHNMQSLSGMSLLFGGWATAHQGSLAGGHETFQEGLSLLRGLGTVIDLPIYLYMHATMLGLARNYSSAIEVATEAIEKSKETGHAYWLAELHRCRAVLISKAGMPKEAGIADLRSAFSIAKRQGANALLKRAADLAEELGLAVEG